MDIKGLDCSQYNGGTVTVADWEAIKQAGYLFGIAKATEGTGITNPDFTEQWAGMWTHGIWRGAYHFGHPGEYLQAQVVEFLGYVMWRGSGQVRRDMFWLDLEVTDGESPLVVSGFARAFVNQVNWITGASCGVYTYPNFAAEGNCAGLEDSPLWIAGPGDPQAPVPAPWKMWTIWQQGTAEGGRLGDLDAANVTSYTQLAALWTSLGSKIVKAAG